MRKKNLSPNMPLVVELGFPFERCTWEENISIISYKNSMTTLVVLQ